MKYIFFTLFGLFAIQFSILAQTLHDQIDYTYDQTGNRINRSIPTIVVFKRGKFENAFEKNPENINPKNSSKIAEISFNVYPNPSNGQVNIKTTNFYLANSLAKIELINSIGEIVFTGEVKESLSSIDLSDLASGTYILRIQTEVLTETFSLIKQ
jgi:hypothetical protein